ncbi:hypothetical protein [Fodinicola acaciae]|uniref:hypothetical protein n=1 Tax=Fodinicola acaciae TaxID=2681555 RepID=UPI0013D1DA66|nr:hypothetical protein [Fodinicola acaciae]
MIARPSTSARLRIGVCLSLSGRYARFGRQVAEALRDWQDWDGTVEVLIEDDASTSARLPSGCDILLGPYSTGLTRKVGRIARDSGRLLWNHGGSGDDVQTGFAGHLISVLTPASRYALPFLDWKADRAPLAIRQGKGSFARQLVEGAVRAAKQRGIPIVEDPSGHDLLCAGSFEEDVEAVRQTKNARRICAVAAGVADFAKEVNATGVFGIGQWLPGTSPKPEIGPDETMFTALDYPAIQAVAAAALAVHCVKTAGSTKDVWQVAARLRTTTMFGAFQIDPVTGAQLGHEAVLGRWNGRYRALRPSKSTSMK